MKFDYIEISVLGIDAIWTATEKIAAHTCCVIGRHGRLNNAVAAAHSLTRRTVRMCSIRL